MKQYAEDGKYALVVLLGVFVLLAAGISTAGYRYYRNYEQRYRDQVEHQLAAIADLKVDALRDWRQERLGNAQLLYQNAAFSALVSRYLDAPQDAETQGQLELWLAKYRGYYQYDQVRLLDTQGLTRLSIPADQPQASAAVARFLPQVLQSGQVVFVDFYRHDHDQRIYLAVLVPILAAQEDKRAIGVLALRIDPETYLYPFIKGWPIPSRTAETMLVRRDGNDVLYLSELRFQKGTALDLRTPLARTEVTGVKAVLGQEGIVEGEDYRGVQVLAALRRVPDSPWFVVARMDEAEVSAPLKTRAWEIAALFSALVFLAGTAVVVGWRQQQVRFYRAKYEGEAALHESELRYRALFENMLAGVAYCQMLFDDQGRPVDFVYLSVNDGFARLTGLADVVGKRVTEAIPGIKELTPELFETYGRVALTGKPERFEIDFKPLAQWFSISVYSPGRGYFVAVFDNITERKEVERRTAIHLALQRVRNQILQMQGEEDWEKVFVFLDQELRGLVSYNAASINLIDWERNQVTSYGWNQAQGFHLNLTERIHPALRETVETGRYVQRRRGDPLFGSELLPEVNAVIDVPFLGGTLALNTTRGEGFGEADIEALEQFAPVISEAFRRLQDLQALATAERNLLQAQKMEAVGQLAGGVAHDFNNLLTVINGYGEILLEHLGKKDLEQTPVSEILKAAERGSGLVRQLLAFSRRQLLQPEVLDLNAVVDDLGKMLRPLVREDIRLVTNLAPDLGKVKADRGQLEQVLMNLAVNARDAMPQGGKLIIETGNLHLDNSYIQQHGMGAPGPYVVLSVSDTGVGMDAATQARIFEPFFTTKAPGKGTGLGLATVYGIVKQSGGYIWVYSEPGRGTTFKIYLPRVEEGAREASPEAPQAAVGEGETLLLVEDEEAVRRLMGIVLREEGYTVLMASLGEEALQISQQHQGPIHLVVSDMVMPGMTGRELVERLGRLRPGLKSLFISGYSEQIAEHQGMLEPGTAFLQKPFKHDALLRKVRETLDCAPHN